MASRLIVDCSTGEEVTRDLTQAEEKDLAETIARIAEDGKRKAAVEAKREEILTKLAAVIEVQVDDLKVALGAGMRDKGKTKPGTPPRRVTR